MSLSNHDPIPYYGLPDSLVRKRRLEGGGWDLIEVMHRPIGGGGKIGVRVTRRRLSERIRGPRPPTPVRTARDEAAIAVALAAGATMHDPLGEIAHDLVTNGLWTPTTMHIDGKDEVAHELTYRGAWVAQHIGEDILIAIVGSPDAHRPEHLAVVKLDPSQFGIKGMTGPDDPPTDPTDWTVVASPE